MRNSEIASLFLKLANLLEILGENPFKIRAYKNAARVIENYPKPLEELVKENYDLTKLPGIGKEISKKIIEIIKTKKLSKLENLRNRIPSSLTKLLAIEGLGAKRVKILYQKLGITNEKQLKDAALKHKIRAIKGFGEKTEEKIINGLKLLKQEGIRHLYSFAKPFANDLILYLKQAPNILSVEMAGSFRRRKETVGDLDILATAKEPQDVINFFTKYHDILEVIVAGDTRATIILNNNLQVDLRVVKQDSFGSALHYFTGSKAHVIKIREMALDMGLKVNEYGVFKNGKSIASFSEEDIYRTFGMEYIQPELRENRGEIDAAKRGKLPNLIKQKDIKGDLHMHTTYSDGLNSIMQMAKKAKEFNYEYIAISDHSAKMAIVKGVDEKKVINYIEEINKLNSRFKNLKILKAIEVDILEDGSLAISNEILKRLDLIIGAIHSKFKLSKSSQTNRILKAMPKINILAHPTGRVIGKREAMDFDFLKVCEVAINENVILEINSQPTRMDLKDNLILEAKKRGVKFSIATDAHSTSELEFIEYGLNQARRGWLESRDVINTLSLKDIKSIFAF